MKTLFLFFLTTMPLLASTGDWPWLAVTLNERELFTLPAYSELALPAQARKCDLQLSEDGLLFAPVQWFDAGDEAQLDETVRLAAAADYPRLLRLAPGTAACRFWYAVDERRYTLSATRLQPVAEPVARIVAIDDYHWRRFQLQTTPQTLRLRGPGVIEFEAHMSEPEKPAWWIYRFDEGGEHALRWPASYHRFAGYTVDGVPQDLSTARRWMLTIPAGEHDLHFSSERAIYGRWRLAPALRFNNEFAQLQAAARRAQDLRLVRTERNRQRAPQTDFFRAIPPHGAARAEARLWRLAESSISDDGSLTDVSTSVLTMQHMKDGELRFPRQQVAQESDIQIHLATLDDALALPDLYFDEQPIAWTLTPTMSSDAKDVDIDETVNTEQLYAPVSIGGRVTLHVPAGVRAIRLRADRDVWVNVAERSAALTALSATQLRSRVSTAQAQQRQQALHAALAQAAVGTAASAPPDADFWMQRLSDLQWRVQVLALPLLRQIAKQDGYACDSALFGELATEKDPLLEQRVLEGCAVYGNDAASHEAQARLQAIYAADRRYNRWPALLAARVLQTRDDAAVIALADEWYRRDQGDLAAQIALAYPAAEVLQRHLQQLAAAHSTAALNVGELIDRLKVAPKLDGVIWRRWPDSVSYSAGQILAQSPTSVQPASFDTATPQQALRARFWGPARLRLHVRVLASNGAATADDWLRITQHATDPNAQGAVPHQWRRPLLGQTLDENDLPLRSDEGDVLGHDQIIDWQLGDGIADLSLQAERQTIAVQFEWLQPEEAQIPRTMAQWQEVNAFYCEPEPCLAQPADVAAQWDDSVISPSQSDDDGSLAAVIAVLDRFEHAAQSGASSQPDIDALRQKGLALAQEYTGSRWGLRLQSRFWQNGSWSEVTSIRRSAGVQMLPADLHWDAPLTRARLRWLQPQLVPQQHLLTNGADDVLDLVSAKPTQLRLLLRQHRLPYAVPAAQDVEIWRDGELLQTLRVAATAKALAFDVALPAGEHNLRLKLLQTYSDRFVSAQWQRAADRDWSDLQDEDKRYGMLADGQQPIALVLPQATWLRIDRLRARSLQTEYRWLPAGEHLFGPDTGAGKTGAQEHSEVLRFFAWQSTGDDKRQRPAERALAPLTAGRPLQAEPLFKSLRTAPRSAREEQPNSYALGVDFGQPRAIYDPLQDPATRGELRFSWRRWWNDSPLYTRTDVAQRSHASVGIEQWLDWDDPRSPWQAWLHLEGWRQQAIADDGPALHAWKASARGDYEWAWDEEWILRLYGYVFEHRSSIDAARADLLDYIDPDIYTPYAARHRRGAQLGGEASWMYYRDWQFFGAAALATTERWTKVDHERIEVGTRAWWRGNVLEFAMQQRHDEETLDRATSRWQARFNLDWRYRWRSAMPQGWETSAGLAYEPGGGGWLWHVGLQWRWDGRGLADYRRREDSFRELEQLRYYDAARAD